MTVRRALLLTLSALALRAALAEPPPLGRLFFTPEQRAMLDRQRRLNPAFDPGANNQASLTINGEVRRSSGHNSTWINGDVRHDAAAPAPGLPVGDTLEPGTGERQSLLGNGRIVVTPGRGGK